MQSQAGVMTSCVPVTDNPKLLSDIAYESLTSDGLPKKQVLTDVAGALRALT